MPSTWLFLDFNSYFASVEQQLQPQLRGHPVAVAPVIADSGCCIAASYEAKRFGVTTGTRIREARQLCPDIQIVPARPALYVQMHHRLVEAVETCLPIAAVHSIDELSCRLGRGQREPDAATDLARRIKAAIASRVGDSMRCSIGLAPNRFLAKVATDMQKPDGLVIIDKDELPGRLYHLKPIDLPGIGPRMNARLQAHGITTMQQLCSLTRQDFRALWESVVGERFWRWLRGEDLDEAPTTRRSIGHQHVLPPELREEHQARAVAIRLLLKAAARMRALGYWAQMLTLGISLEPDRRGPRHLAPDPAFGWTRRSWHASAKLEHGSQDSLRMVEELSRLWARRPPGRPKLVDVTFSDLIPDAGVTMPLFAPEQTRQKLSHALDAINQKYGRMAVYTGGIHNVRDSARGGIAFHSIPDLTLADTVDDGTAPHPHQR